MWALVKQNAAAFSAPGCTPCARIIICLWTIPICYYPIGSSDLAKLAAFDYFAHFTENAVCTLIEHHSKNKLGMLVCFCHHLSDLKGINACRLFAHNMESLSERFYCICRVVIVRYCYQYRINKTWIHHIVGIIEIHGFIQRRIICGIFLKSFFCGIKSFGIDIGDCGYLNLGALSFHNIVEMVCTHISEADYAYMYLIV